MVLDNAHVTLPEINTLERDVPDLTAGSVAYELYLSGVLNGVDEYGTFDGQHTVTRGQAAAMLARLVDPAQRLKLSFQSFSQCRDILGVDPAAVLLNGGGLLRSTVSRAAETVKPLAYERESGYSRRIDLS